ncbi:acyl-homoserine-lactone synthase [Roseobacter sp. N2S]|uniref:acyl-homoserine-lactone synthase n=1 Tax=Roseobacter sp. N2S TaxID=2663844 RepID=UPI00285E84D4|nr:acyl-homoserine-lactone synthase [Roseobacter sp. N2S]MDR6265232.1 acyl homoserine lactone synthase [Roseobacter sp. N2S]
MLSYIYADEIAAFPLLQETMFKDRKVQFHDRLGWEVAIDAAGHERDEYDTINPLYAIWQLPDGSHGGSMRALPTTGPCMTNDHFGDITGGPITSPLIWESTRFCLSPRVDSAAGQISAAIMLAGCEIGLNFGLRHAVGVFDPRMVRIYRRLGWSPEVLGSKGVGRGRVSVGLWEFSEGIRRTLCQAAQVTPAQSTGWFEDCFGPASVLRQAPQRV